jgi:hypothetical protein
MGTLYRRVVRKTYTVVEIYDGKSNRDPIYLERDAALIRSLDQNDPTVEVIENYTPLTPVEEAIFVGKTHSAPPPRN